MKKQSNSSPAVAYVRMSSKKQDKSPEQQRAEIKKHARNRNYHIIRWYEDSGKSGGKETEKRVQFLRLIEDAENKGDFVAILSWSKARLDRLDSLEGAEYKLRLRDCGVILDTVTDGVFDWATEEGQLLDAFHSMKGHRDLIQISREAIRGKTEAILERKRLHGGQPPYGMARLITDSKGKKHNIARGESFRTPKEWNVIYVKGNPDELAVLKWLFTTFDSKDVSCHWLAKDLNERGVSSPNGSQWRDTTVRRLLTDEAYIGNFVLGKKRTKESFYRITNEGAKKNVGPRGRLAKTSTGDPSEEIRLDGLWDAVVDPALFLRVNRKLNSNKKSGRKPRATDGGHALSGILHCGHCGSRLLAMKKVKKAGPVTRYHCGTYLNTPGNCIGAKIDEGEVIDKALLKLGEMLSGDRISEFGKAVREEEPIRSECIQREIQKVELQIERGSARMCMVDSDKVAQSIQRQLASLHSEKERLEGELACLLKPEEVPALVDRWASKHRSLLRLYSVPLLETIKVSEHRTWYGTNLGVVETQPLEALALRGAFNEIGLRLDVFWRKREKRTREGIYELDRVEISVNIGELENHFSSDRRRSIPPGSTESGLAWPPRW